jgi:hypothetical protein
MNKLQKIDAAIIGVIEYASHAIQWLTGYDCFDQARVFAGFSVCFLIVSILDLFHEKPYMTVFFVVLLTFGWIDEVLFIGRSRERATLVRRNPEFANPAKEAWVLRLPLATTEFIVGALPPHRAILTDISLILIALWIYLAACNPLPPGTSKVRQWLNAMKRKPVPVQVTST